MKHFLSIITFLIVLFELTICDNTVDVRIKNGLIHGRRQSFEGREYNQFLGIPYAEPPIGPLRFKKPVPRKEWSQPMQAYEWPVSCVHNRYMKPQDYFNQQMSEDCLYMNIWSPNAPESGDSLKPVMFFIHGGGFNFGSASEDAYSGHVLATKGDVVVVTLNYRLAIFGLLYTGTDEAPGNMALWDQALALEWVNDNIQYFGGDPNRITLFGESAGAWSVSLHLLSPVTRNLYQNAIIMSGAIFHNVPVCRPEAVLDMWIDRVEKAGCVDEDNRDLTKRRFTTEMFECLNALSVEALRDIPAIHFNYCMMPLVIDGTMIVDQPIKSLRSGDHKKNFNLMIGTTEDEGSFILEMMVDSVKYNKHAPKPINYEEAVTGLAQIMKEPFGVDGEAVSKVYFNGLSDNNSQDLLRRTMGIAFGDWFCTCPTISFAKQLYSTNPETNVFQYYFNSKVGDPNKMFCSYWMGSCHFNDIYPVFGVPFYDPDRYLDKEREIAEQMIDIFASFAKNGRPPAQRSAEWQSFYKLNDNIIAPFYEITDEPKPNTNFGINLKFTECEFLWKKYIIPENV